MRVIEHRRPPTRSKPRRTRGLQRVSLLLVFLLVGTMGLATWRYLRPLPPFEVNVADLEHTGQKPKLAWPAYGQSAVGAVGYGVLSQQGSTEAKPIASITKVVTALTVLQEKPLKPGEAGPKIAITKADMAIYDAYQAIDGSVVPVRAGEELTEYQMLQALLLPSANNLADTLAIWAFGSLEKFQRAANAYVASLGMSDTQISDASGFSPKSVSTATDLIRLGQAAMKHPVVKGIVNQSEVPFPVAGKIYNVNGMLGKNGIVGIKPGNTDEAGGCFLGAATVKLSNGKEVTVLSAIMGGPNLIQALVDSRKLLATIPQGFDTMTLVPAGTSVGYVNVPWGEPVALKTQTALTITDWTGRTYKPVVRLNDFKAPQSAQAVVGTLWANETHGSPQVDILLAAPVLPPPARWRRDNVF